VGAAGGSCDRAAAAGGQELGGCPADLITYSEAGDNLQVRSYQGPSGSSGSTDEHPGGIALDTATDTVYVTGVRVRHRDHACHAGVRPHRSGTGVGRGVRPARVLQPLCVEGDRPGLVSGNLYVLAEVPSFVARDQLLLAYSPDAGLLWQATFGQPRDDEVPAAVAVDSVTGTVYTTGRKYNHATGDHSVYTTAYSTDGVLKWARTAPGAEARALAMDETRGGVYVTGQGPTADYLTLAYSAAGQTLLSRSAGTSEVDAAVDIAVDEATGRVYVTGSSVPASRQSRTT